MRTRMREIATLLLGVMIAGASAHAAQPGKKNITPIAVTEHLGGARHAVIIGINDYADPAIPDLQTCVNDAQAMFDLLSDPNAGAVSPDNITLLLNKDATLANIKDALANLRFVPEDSTVFIYYSGHGAKEHGDAFWVTQDAVLSKLTSTALPEFDITRFVSRANSDRKIVFIDSCFAAETIGDGAKSLSDFNATLSGFTGSGTAILSAAADGQEAIESPDKLRHSVFTFYLLQGLRGHADTNKDGVIVLPELTTYIDLHVADEARKRGGLQNPVVDLANAREPAKFRLAVNLTQLEQFVNGNAQSEAQRQARESAIKKMSLENLLTVEQFHEARDLLRASSGSLGERDRERLDAYIQVADGDVLPSQLSRLLSLADQRDRDREVDILMNTARQNDVKGDVSALRRAADALDAVMEADPSHEAARSLYHKIEGYFFEFKKDPRGFMSVPAIRTEMFDLEDPIVAGTNTTFLVTVTNTGSGPATNIQLDLQLGRGLEVIDVQGATASSKSGERWIIDPLAALAPQSRAEWRITVRATSRAVSRTNVSVIADHMLRPDLEQESTTIWD